MSIKTTWVVLIGLIGCATPGAPSALPDDMKARFSPSTSYAERLYVTAPGSSDTVRVDIAFANDEKNEVSMRWTAQAAGAYETVVDSKHPVAYQPTAIAKRAGQSSTVYVVGWSSQTAQVLVEEWTLGTFTVAAAVAAQPLAQPGETLLTLPPVNRTLLWASADDELNPIWDAASYPYADELWLLESGPVTRIHAYDPRLGALALRYASDGAGMGGLTGHRSLGAGQHEEHGFVILSQPKRPWDSLRHQPQDATMFVVTDTDSNGSLDSETFLTLDAYGSTYAGGWDMKYQDP
jgi:hypothetical protein